MISVAKLRDALGGSRRQWWDAWFEGDAEYVPSSKVERFLYDHADRLIG